MFWTPQWFFEYFASSLIEFLLHFFDGELIGLFAIFIKSFSEEFASHFVNYVFMDFLIECWGDDRREIIGGIFHQNVARFTINIQCRKNDQEAIRWARINVGNFFAVNSIVRGVFESWQVWTIFIRSIQNWYFRALRQRSFRCFGFFILSFPWLLFNIRIIRIVFRLFIDLLAFTFDTFVSGTITFAIVFAFIRAVDYYVVIFAKLIFASIFLVFDVIGSDF